MNCQRQLALKDNIVYQYCTTHAWSSHSYISSPGETNAEWRRHLVETDIFHTYYYKGKKGEWYCPCGKWAYSEEPSGIDMSKEAYRSYRAHIPDWK